MRIRIEVEGEDEYDTLMALANVLDAGRLISGPDKLFVSASEVARAADACGEPLSAPKHGERKAVG